MKETNMTRIKLIATDVDGTFLNSQRTYNHNRFAAQLNRLSSASIRLSLPVATTSAI